MNKRSIFIMLFALLAIMSLAVSVSADQDGHDNWCNEDEYGCWVTDEDGGKCYIMFWSEEARAYFMGGHSKPGELVTDKPNTPGGRMGMNPSLKRNWRDIWIDLLNNHRALLESQGVDVSELITTTIKGFENDIANGVQNEGDIIESARYWDEAYTSDEKNK